MALTTDKFRFFSHDADMRNDIKIKALRRKFGNDGYAVWNYLLETLTDNEEWEITFNKDTAELYAADFDVTPDRLTEIIEYAIHIGLLQRNEAVIFSIRHQERLQEVADRRERKEREREGISKVRSEAGKLGAQKRWGKSDDDTNIANDNTVMASGIANDAYKIEEIREDKIRIEKKREENKIDYQKIVSVWNETCSSLPKVRQLNDVRRNKIKTRLTEFGCKTPDEVEAFVRELFGRCQSSAFLCGQNNQGWTATFDWIFENPTNWVKVIEGNYDNSRGANRGRTGVEKSLGVGEYISPDGTRSYGSGKAIIPLSAPPRPSDRHSWDAQTQQWILI